MSADDLVRELEPLRHTERVARLLSLGDRVAAGDEDANKLVDDLAASDDRYRRCLAAGTIYRSRDSKLALRLLGDASRVVRRRARRVAPIVLTDDQCVEAVFGARSPRDRRALLIELLRRGRRAAAQRALAIALKHDAPGGLLDCVAYLDESTLSSLIGDCIEKLSLIGLKRLARHHPRALVGHFAQLLEDGIQSRLRWQLLAVLPALAEHAPLQALPFIESLLTSGTSPYVAQSVATSLRIALRKCPRETFQLLRKLHVSARPMPPPGPFGIVRFDGVVHRLNDEQLTYLMSHGWGSLTDGVKARRWFLRLSERQREIVKQAFLHHVRGSWGAFLFRHIDPDGRDADPRAIAYQRFTAAAQNKDGMIAAATLAALPRDLKVREGKRHLYDVVALTTQPAARIAYAAFLPLDDAKEALSSYLSHPEPEIRAVAMRAVASIVQTHPEQLVEVVELLKTRRFEQDPVRQQMFDALSLLPHRALVSLEDDARRQALSAMGELIEYALDAADLSTTTSFYIERLLVRLFRVDGEWCAEQLVKLLRVRGTPSSLGLVEHVAPADIKALMPAVTELCVQWSTRERSHALLWLARSFGRRLSLVPPLQDALVRAATEQPFVDIAGASLSLLRQHITPLFVETAERLLDVDASCILLADIARHVSTRRQDRLDAFLTGKPMKGRFATGRTNWVIDFAVGYGSWTQSQQTKQAALWVGLLNDEARDVPALRHAVVGLTALAFVTSSHLAAFADDKRAPVRELAVRGLGRVDDPAAAEALFDCLADDRARWAIYALRAVVRERTPSEAVELLKRAPMKKVTVAKEVIRLVGEMGGSAGYAFLTRLSRSKVPLHRDVRIALLRALWDHLEQDETWAIFEEAVRDPDWVVAGRLADVPTGRLSAASEKRLTALLVRVLERPEPEARLDLLRRAANLPLADRERTLFKACLAHLRAPHQDEVRAALFAVLTRMRSGDERPVSEEILERTMNRRTFDTIMQGLVSRLGPYAARPVVDVGHRVLREVTDDPMLVVHTLRLSGALLDAEELVRQLSKLSSRRLLHFDAMVAAELAVRACVSPRALEPKLRVAADPRLRRLGLCALEHAARPDHGWSATDVRVLEQYRKDSDPLVAGHAQFVFPPEKRAETARPGPLDSRS